MRLAGPIIEREAKAALGGYRAVRYDSGGVNYADATNLSHKTGAIGITRGAADLAATAEVQVFGPLEDLAWTWTPEEWIYVGSNGVLTQTPPISGWSQRVAIAESATRIFISVQKPIIKG